MEVRNGETWGVMWQSLNIPRLYALAFLILAGIVSRIFDSFWYGIVVVYTHFSCLIVVFTGLWY